MGATNTRQASVEPSKTGSPASGAKLPAVVRDLERMLGSVFGKDRVPALSPLVHNPKTLKAKLSEAIESLPARASRLDFSVAASLFLARKVVPAPAGEDPIPGYISKMGCTQTIDSEFLHFCSIELEKMFPKGWDSSYVRYCCDTIPSGGSSTERTRKNGGAREEIISEMSREDFVTACLAGAEISIPSNRLVRVLCDDGKYRIVTIASARQWVLSPLHKLLYDHISGFKWLLRGEATGNRFKGFFRVRGEVFISGDFEGATDNFNRLHSEFILEIILRSSNIPESIQRLALDSLHGTITVPDGSTHPQVAGQLMGNLLSFPLLCVTNYLAFKFAIRREVPLRINGDDIVFRATPREAARWKQVVSRAGFVLSKGKTLSHERFFSLNSTFFEGRFGRKPSLVPVVRSKSVYAPLAFRAGDALAARLHKSCKGLSGAAKGIVKGHILSFHRKAVGTIRCSLNRALGGLVSYPVLQSSGLLEQEAFFLNQPAQLDKLPRGARKGDPPLRATVGAEQIPRRWVAKNVARRYEVWWNRRLSEYAWTPGNFAVVEEMAEPTVDEFRPLDRKKLARLAKESRRGLGRLLVRAWRRTKHVIRWAVNMERVERPPETIWVPRGDGKHWQPTTRFRPSRG